MALTPQQKALRELEGDTPELVAWGLMDWIRQVEQINDRNGMLTAFNQSLSAAREGVAASAGAAGEPATGTQRRLAFKLTHLIAEMEGRDIGLRNQADRTWILATYSECLATVLGKRALVEPALVEPAVG